MCSWQIDDDDDDVGLWANFPNILFPPFHCCFSLLPFPSPVLLSLFLCSDFSLPYPRPYISNSIPLLLPKNPAKRIGGTLLVHTAET